MSSLLLAACHGNPSAPILGDGGYADASDLPGPWSPPGVTGAGATEPPTRFGSIVNANPAVLVNSTSLGGWTATTNGINVAAGETVSVKLVDSAGVRLWQLTTVGTDERVAAPTITQSSVVTGSASFVAPAAGSPVGWALVIRSQIGVTALGNDATGKNNPAYSTTFGVYLPTSNSYRVGAVNETVEGNAAYGWVAKFNPLLRANIATGSGVGTDRTLATTGLLQGGGNLSTDRTLSVVPGTNGQVAVTAAGVPSWALISNTNIASGAAIDLGKLSQTSAATGQAITWNGSQWAPGAVVGTSGATCAVADLAALRAVVAASRTDNQSCTVGSPLSVWTFSSSTGAGFADDGNATTGGTVIKPNDVLLASNGRWFQPGPIAPTIAALRLAVSGKNPTIQVQAYRAEGDGGGDIFDLQTGSCTDNGGNLIVAGTKCYKRRAPAGLYRYRAFGGCTSCTTTVNTAAMLAAVTAANTAGGGTVFVEDGDYNVTVPAAHGSTAFHVTGFSNITIQGAGRYKARLVDSGSTAAPGELYPTELGDPGGTAAFLTFENATNVHIKDLGFVGKGVFNQANVGQTAVNKKAIYFKSTVGAATTDCSVTDSYFTLIEGETVFADGWPNRLHVDRNHFVRCLSNQINYGGASQAVNKSANCSADDNVIESPGTSAFQGGGSQYSFSRNKISMLPADAAITTSSAILIVNSKNFVLEDNVFDGLIYSGGTTGVLMGYQGDTDGCTGTRIRNNTFSNWKILGSAPAPTTAVVAIDSTYGPQVGYVIEGNKFLGIAEQNHGSYPHVVAIRVNGTGAHTGIVGPNDIQSNGVTNPLDTGVLINSGVPGGNGISVRPHVFDSSVTAPYTFTVLPAMPGLNIPASVANVKLTTYAGSPEGNVTAGIGSICEDVTNGALYVKNTGAGNTGWLLLTTGAAGSYVPTTRNITAGTGLTQTPGTTLASDMTINAVANADGSIICNANDIQVGVLASDAQHGARGGGTQHTAVTNAAAGFAPLISAANRVLLSTSGTSSTWGQVDLATAQVTGALPNANQAAQSLAGDVTGTTAADAVVAITGSAGTATIGSSTKLAWSAGPSLEKGGPFGNGLVLKAGTGDVVHFYDNTNDIGWFQWNGGNTIYQVPSGASTFAIDADQGTSQYIRLFVAGTTPQGILLDANDIWFRTGGGVSKGRFNNTGLRFGDGAAADQAVDVAGRIHLRESTEPSTPADGGIFWVNATGDLFFKGKGGTVTPIATHFWSPSVEGMPANDNGVECEPWQRECAGWR